MAVATVTSKGQITIPAGVRRQLGLRAGDRIDFVVEAGGEVRLKPKKRPLEDLLGILRGSGKKPLSVEEMHETVLDAAVEDWSRLRSRGD